MSKRVVRTGATVSMTCYKETCTHVSLKVKLGEEGTVYWGFTGAGRFHWPSGTRVRSFDLRPYEHCPKCKTAFASAIVVSNGRSKAPTIFGYDPEPA